MASTPTDVRFFPVQGFPSSGGSKSIPIHSGKGFDGSNHDNNRHHMEQAMAQEAAEYRDMVMFKRIYSMRQGGGSNSSSCLMMEEDEAERVIRWGGESPTQPSKHHQQPHHRRTWSAPSEQQQQHQSLWRETTTTVTTSPAALAEKELPPRPPHTQYVNLTGGKPLLPPRPTTTSRTTTTSQEPQYQKQTTPSVMTLADHARYIATRPDTTTTQGYSWPTAPQPSSTLGLLEQQQPQQDHTEDEEGIFDLEL